MNEKWTDFEKFVFKELTSLSKRVGNIEGRVMAIGAIAAIVATAVSEFLIKAIVK